jgi:hypothetical protein
VLFCNCFCGLARDSCCVAAVHVARGERFSKDTQAKPNKLREAYLQTCPVMGGLPPAAELSNDRDAGLAGVAGPVEMGTASSSEW